MQVLEDSSYQHLNIAFKELDHYQNFMIGFSFPSGHSTFVALFFLALLFVINKKEILAVIATFAIIAVPIQE